MTEVQYIIQEDDGPRRLGYIEYARRLDNTTIATLFDDEVVQEDMLSASLYHGAAPVKIANLNLIKRDHQEESQVDEFDDSLPGGSRGANGEPLTPLGLSLSSLLLRASKPPEKDPAILVAVKSGSLFNVIETLKEFKPAQEPVTDKNGWDPLIWSSHIGNSSITAALIDSKFFSARHTDSKGNTALMWASRLGHTDIVTELLRTDAVVDHQNDGYLKSALMWACQEGNKATVKELLLHKANVHLVCSEGSTVLHMATRAASVELMTMLVEAGVDVAKQDIHGMTALHYAAAAGLTHAVEYLSSVIEDIHVEPKERNLFTMKSKHSFTSRQLAASCASRSHERCVAILAQKEVL